jgi:hypothetical protein
MSSFLSDTYSKPKLVENKLVKKIIDEQNKEVTIESKIKVKLFDLLKKNYIIIIVSVIILGGLYWRYIETQKKKELNSDKKIEYVSDSEDSDD